MPAGDFLLGLGTLAGGVGALAQGFGIGANRNAPSGNTVFWQGVGEREKERQRQDNFIQRRVADARAAGLHPLFALGAQGNSPVFGAGGSYGPQSGMDYGAMGYGAGNIMRGLAQILHRKEKAVASSAETQAQKDKLELAAMRRFYGNVAAPAMAGFVPGATEIDEPVVPTRSTVDQVISSDGSITLPEWDEKLAGAIAAGARDAGRAVAKWQRRGKSAAARERGRTMYHFRPEGTKGRKRPPYVRSRKQLMKQWSR